ncbi:MAG: GNAT family N-acetyltransferase [Lachnospiraceae bacterium]|nr:GNAT family N-acetyltransferase [Lachnospiraceae bacterium]
MRLMLREVTGKDIDLLFQWANDPETRQNAFHTEQIPYDTHRTWFVKMLADRDVLKYILCNITNTGEMQDIGQIRLSIEDGEALIDYSIDSEKRGQGFGTRMILMAEEKLREVRADVTYCKGQVKKMNIASAKAFEKCGYDVEEREQYLEFVKRIRS